MEAGQRTRTINTRGVAHGRATRRRWTTAGAAALFTILMAGSGIANAQTVIWEATLEVGEFGNVSGFSVLRSLGTLTPSTFRYKGQTLEVNNIVVSTLEGTTELFLGINDVFSKDPALGNWTLTVGSTDYTEATADPDTGRHEWAWTTYPSWSNGDSITVKLTTTEPGAPRNVTAVDLDENGPTVALAWAAPASVGSTAITTYQYRRGGLAYGSYDEWTDIAGGGSVTSADVKMPYAWPDATYPFQMRAVNSSGEGLWSNVSRAEVVDEREGLQVSDTSAYEGYNNTPAGRARNIGDANMLKFDITIDPPAGTGNWIEVTLSSQQGSATEHEDYDPRILVRASNPDPNHYFGQWEHITHFRFEENETEQSVYVRVIDDAVEDSGETMTLHAHIHRVQGLDWHDRPPPKKTSGIGTIYNDEEVGQSARASVANVEARESDEEMDFTITLSESVSADVSVLYGTKDGSAAAGSDYTETRGWAELLGGETTKTITVPIIDDDVDERKEQFQFRLVDFVNLGGGSGATGTIVDEDVTALTAEFRNMPASHEGEGEDFSFQLKFNQKVTTKYRVMEDHVFEITNGEVSDARRVDKRRDLWKITIEPDGDDDVVVTLPATTICSATGAVCSQTDQGKPSQPLSRSVTATVAGPQPDPITATFSEMPDEHQGSGVFTFELGFSENINAGFRRIRDKAFTVTGGDIKKAQRKTQGSNQNWKITVKPDGSEDVTLTLPETTDCDDDGAICTAEGGMLNHSTSDTVLGPVGISIADTEVEEDANAVLVFAVALSRAASSQLTIDYATSDGTATAGADYTATSGTLTIDAGSSSGSIEVGVIDDEHNEGSETFTLTLSNASSGDLTDASATGTITNHDAVPKALIARFGRTAAVHIVEQVEERVNAPRRPGFDGRVAGRQINRDMGQRFALDFLQQLGGSGHGQRQAGASGQMTAAGARNPRFGNGGRTSSLGPQNAISGAMDPSASMQGLHPAQTYDHGMGMGLGGDRLLQRSSFALNRATSSGGVLSFWSRSAQSQFYGQDGALALNGDVRSTMFGADYSKGRMVTGVSLSHSRGLGRYAGGDSGQVSSAVTGLYPWVGYKANERVTVWTVAGYGAGGLMLNPGAGPPIETGLSMAMAAGGGRGQILGGGEGFGLAFKADTLWVGMRTKAASGPGGNLDSTTAAVSRLRTALEGSQSMTIANRMALTPSVEVGIRQDGGDAETGRGIDLGAGLVLADGVTGLAVDIRVRRLLVHQADGFAESGMSISVSYNPTPSTPLGFSARVSPAWGGDSMSGAEALWGRESMAGMGRDQMLGGGNRLDTEVGYGLPIGARFVGTPRVGLRTSEYGRDYRLGYSMNVLEATKLKLQIGVEAERRQIPAFLLQDGATGRDQRVLGRATVEW